MLRVARPSDAKIAAFRAEQSRLELSYDSAGMTRDGPTTRFTLDHNRLELGSTNATWTHAKRALSSWSMFDLGWVELHTPDAPIATGTTVAILVRAFSLWWLNAARIVYSIDERDRFGFAYGTLPNHVECGEERFLVERRPDGSVAYDLLALSRPRHPFAKIAYPQTRRLQKRFARDSMLAMQRTVSRLAQETP
jgi:uncharacterized protein (UPF0548 family)